MDLVEKISVVVIWPDLLSSRGGRHFGKHLSLA